MLQIRFEQDSNHSATYTELMSFFNNASRCSDQAKFTQFGQSDAGKPLSVFILDKEGKFEPLEENDSRAVILINNGIHPGEPCGIEASMILVRNMIEQQKLQRILDDVVILIIPVYNVGGMLNRNSFSRANQNGPAAYGFRGNAKNLDLNRDFIKADSRNAVAMLGLFNRWKPDIFIDTHTSNGADYQYTMTLIANLKSRLAPSLKALVYDDMLPVVYDDMKNKGWEMAPYVHARTTPDEGIAAFDDLPRYSSGFGALHHIPSFVTEAHMLKPYKDRVMSTYSLFESFLSYTASHRKQVKKAREESIEYYQSLDTAALSFKLNESHSHDLMFKGYQAKTKKSAVTGLDRLYYDRSEPFEKTIPHLQHYENDVVTKIPSTYILPEAYQEVAERLRLNGVVMQRSRRDSTTTSYSYRILDYKSRETPYESHYLHSDVKLAEEIQAYRIHSGDYVISTDQPARRFIVETLEPQGPDSYFAWNFFDGILMQKEYFSSYVFEETAARLLAADAALQKRFNERRESDPEFAKNARAQLDFIYKSSPHYEKTHNLYPVGRIFD
jgi:hypothetical protein